MPSIAVLPFVNRSHSEEDEYFITRPSFDEVPHLRNMDLAD